MRLKHLCFLAACAPLGVTSCGPTAPEECGENVEAVLDLDFSGPNVITTTPDFDFAGYDVSATIRRIDQSQPARICYVVRDEDPWYKLFWAVDDVLDANILFFPPREDSRTFEGDFVLWAKDNNNICGRGSLPGGFKVADCSGEREAEVYVHPYGSPGSKSPVRVVRLQ